MMIQLSVISDEGQNNSPPQSSLDAWKHLTDDEAWALLPAVASGEKQPLPNWVKVIATQMPRTAAAMLELDAAFRLQGPLDPALRAKQRWIVAHANHCNYCEA